MPEEGTGGDLAIGTGAAADNTPGGASGQGGNNSGQSGNNPGWRAGLPSDLRDHEAFRDKGTVGDLGRAYLEAQQKLQNSVVVPGENATADEKKAFFDKLGVPKSSEEYTINDSDDGEFTNHFKSVAHQAGLTAQQASDLHAEILRFSNSRVEALKAQQTEKQQNWETTLKQEWGASYEQKDAAARRFMLVAGAGLADALTETGALNDPRVRKGLYTLSQMISEDRLVSGSGQPSRSGGWNFPNTPGM